VTDLPSPSVVAPGSDVGSVVLSSGFTVSSVVVCCSKVLVVIFSSSFGVVLAVVSLASVLCVVTGVGKVSVVEDVVGFTVFFVVGFVVVEDSISVFGSGDGSVSLFDVTCDVEGVSVIFDSGVLCFPARNKRSGLVLKLTPDV
jgi:cytochrome c oxidase assembly protein Cox11